MKIQKSLVFLYACSEQLTMKSRKQFHLQEHQREEKFKLRNTFKKINAKFML